jgi:NTP pyrophosphatase (non-canonical NTP hydrolase)
MTSEHYMDESGNLTGEGLAAAGAGLAILQEACHRRAKSKGWWSDDLAQRNFGEMVALMHSELSEALEAYRENDNCQEIRYEYKTSNAGTQVLYVSEFVYDDHVELGKPVGIASEFADVLIRIFDTCAALSIPLPDALLQKHAYNGTRGYRHGGKLA